MLGTPPLSYMFPHPGISQTKGREHSHYMLSTPWINSTIPTNGATILKLPHCTLGDYVGPPSDTSPPMFSAITYVTLFTSCAHISIAQIEVRYSRSTINLVHIHHSIEKVILCPCLGITFLFEHTLRNHNQCVFKLQQSLPGHYSVW